VLLEPKLLVLQQVQLVLPRPVLERTRMLQIVQRL
jgi:hypothetical protein